MKSIVSVMVSVTLLGLASAASADKVILKSGASYDVRGFEITAGAVKMVTPEGRAWSVLRDVVNIPATLKANGMSSDATQSPGWTVASTEVVSPKPDTTKASSKYVDKELEKAERDRERDEKKAAKAREREEKEAAKERERAEKKAAKERERAEKEAEKHQDGTEGEDKHENPEGDKHENPEGDKHEKSEEKKPEGEEETIVVSEPVKAPPRPKSMSEGAAEEEPLSKYVVLVNGGYNGTALNFSSSRTFPLYLENGTIQSTYTGGTGAVLEFGAMYRFRGPWAAGGTVELFGGNNNIAFTASLPHPFFFNQPRTLQGTVPSLSYRETAVNLSVFYSYVFRPQIVIDGFGGPTFFVTQTQVLSDVQYTEAFPFTTVALQSPVVSQQNASPVGFNVGGGVTYRWRQWLGFGFSLHYNRATVSVTDVSGTPVSFNAGGVRANGGIRLLFK